MSSSLATIGRLACQGIKDGFRDFMVLALRDHGLERARSSRLSSLTFFRMSANVLFGNTFHLRACHALALS